MAEETKRTIRELFLELPAAIRDWLTSDEATYAVIGINKSHDFTDDLLRIIPSLITRLVVKDISPRTLIQALKRGLVIEEDLAREVAGEIKEKILRPIQSGLKALGIEIEAIDGSGAEGAPTPIKTESAKEPPMKQTSAPAAPIAPSYVRIKPPEITAAEKIPARDLNIEGAENPFLLHEENPVFAPATPPEKPYVSFEPKRESQKPPAPKPVRVRIETPEENAEEAQSEPKIQRVVHYGGFRTPLDDEKS